MIFLLFFLAPMTVAVVIQYLCCRLPRRRFWRGIPPAALTLGALIALWARCRNWGEGPVPVETLLFFPGVPVLGLALGMLFGWRLWHRLWDPRVIQDRLKH